MVYLEELPFKRDMLMRERKLKRGNAIYYEQLTHGDKNIVRNFL